ncbi:hypothetical protein [Halalkalibacter hemicellulosilyticus]|uniref:Uncharacterized protein n=1 Tax=Halalkalibacter hemicellulosilyticusJCM 9152 TaxID=1236971 RepID=W4QFI6_9BACI|nr:hypothetical protein [Halalkalibacter hemicellulosilyticus]GAE30846.1 hypothetical protein JCM9152_2268 [Halalkalibacter hemicellulosilyticusJCM 9152]
MVSRIRRATSEAIASQIKGTEKVDFYFLSGLLYEQAFKFAFAHDMMKKDFKERCGLIGRSDKA